MDGLFFLSTKEFLEEVGNSGIGMNLSLFNSADNMLEANSRLGCRTYDHERFLPDNRRLNRRIIIYKTDIFNLIIQELTYNINDEMYFVDLPGYGYATANEQVKAQWGKLIEDYLHQSGKIKAVFLLIDIRHAPSENDCIMYNWILDRGYQPIIIATKLDKIKRSQIRKQIKLITDTLDVVDDTIVIPYSALTKQGREEIYDLLDGMLAEEQ